MSLPLHETMAPARRYEPDVLVRRDLKVLGEFISIYCENKHKDEPRSLVRLKTHDVANIVGHELYLCGSCTKLLTHAFAKRSACPMDPKPACKHCLEHCYHPAYRQRIQEVMKYSGMRTVLTGRLDYLFHLLF